MSIDYFEKGDEVLPRAVGSRTIVARYVREACDQRLGKNKFLRTPAIIGELNALGLEDVTLIVDEVKDRILSISVHFHTAVLEENFNAHKCVTFDLDRGFFRAKSDS